jgi:hypothetical protein
MDKIGVKLLTSPFFFRIILYQFQRKIRQKKPLKADSKNTQKIFIYTVNDLTLSIIFCIICSKYFF